MKSLIALLFSFLLFVFSCDYAVKEDDTKQGQFKEEKSPLNIVPVKEVDGNFEVTKTSEESSCYVTDMYRVGKRIYVDVDFVDIKDVASGGGYEIVNKNPRIRTFELIKDKYAAWNPADTATVKQLYKNWKREYEYYLQELGSEENQRTGEKPSPSNRYVIETQDGNVIRFFVDLAG